MLIPFIGAPRPSERAGRNTAAIVNGPRLERPSSEAERRLLVVSYHFPPDPAVGGLRWSGLTKYLAAHGWRSWVVTAAPQPTQATPGVFVTSRPRRATLNDVYGQLRRRLRPDRPQSAPAAAAPLVASAANVAPAKPSWLATLRLEAGVLLAIPDHSRGWMLHAAWTTRRLIAQVRPSVVVSSGPPHSAHIAAWIATRFTNIPWYVDLRDPWAGPKTEAWRNSVFFRSRVARWTAIALERLALRSATTIICNSREFAAALALRYPNAAIECVPNAVDHEMLPTVSAEPFPGFGIVHAGTIYGGRDFGPVLTALRTFLDRHPEATYDGTRLRIAGHVSESYIGTLKKQIAELNLEGHVEFLGTLSRPDALKVVGRSRLAVVLAQGQEFQVPAKLYEMVGMGVQTVVLASEPSAASSEALRLGATAIDPRNTLGLAMLMDQASRASGAPPRRSGLSDYQHLADRVSALLLAPHRGAEPVVRDWRAVG